VNEGVEKGKKLRIRKWNMRWENLYIRMADNEGNGEKKGKLER
jgi:uncharacterized protein (DUF1919 family)